MSISAQIARLEQAKADIAAAITAKGVNVPEGAKLDDMAALIMKLHVVAEYAPYVHPYDYAKPDK